MICLNKKKGIKKMSALLSAFVPRSSNISEIQENFSGTKIHGTALIYFKYNTV